MATAPSFRDLEILKEPFIENGKEYVIVKTKSGTSRKVRWYPEENVKLNTLKHTLGFEKGYITIFKGDTYPLLEWFRAEPACRYNSFWGWYVSSEDEVPTCPAGIETVQLLWDSVAFPDEDALRPESAIKEAVEALLYEASLSEWQGQVGDRIERTLTVIKITDLGEGFYGPSTFFLFTDGVNEYCWTTGSKQLELGKTYNVKGSIKALQTYKAKKQTVLTRCRIG